MLMNYELFLYYLIQNQTVSKVSILRIYMYANNATFETLNETSINFN